MAAEEPTKLSAPPAEFVSLEAKVLNREPGQGQKKRAEGRARRAEERGKAEDKGKGGGRDKDGRPKEPEPLKDPEFGQKLRKFTRPGVPDKSKGIKEKKLGAFLKKNRRNENESRFLLAKGEVLNTAEAGLLEAEGREKTFKLKQQDIAKHVTRGVARKQFSLDLPYGPYHCAYTRNGTHMLAGGRKGHVALLHCETMQLTAEMHLKETVRAVQPLHNHTMFAVAQKKYVNIYDHQGIELHCLKEAKAQSHLAFLPYHYLLVSAGEQSDLHYRDISTGQALSKHRTRLGACRSMTTDSRNGVVHLGHSNGTVTLWTPTVKEPVVKVFCHAGHVSALACHGNYMVSAGADGMWKVWDLRKYTSLSGFKNYGHAASGIDISMTGLVSICFGSHVEIWKDVLDKERPRSPYMNSEYPGRLVSSVCFRPYEDVCAVGHSKGFENIIVPGAGLANFDSFEATPFETKKQRREREVRTLMEKLQPDSIMLNPSQIGNINHGVVKAYKEEAKAAKIAAEEEEAKQQKKKKKMRGADKAGRRLKRKQLSGAKDQRQKIKDRLDGEGGSEDDSGDDESVAGGGGADAGDGSSRPSGTLGRFYGKRQRKT